MATSVSEFDILLATIRWLLEKGWRVDSVSIAPSSELASMQERKEEVKRLLRAASWSLDEDGFRPIGPDIVAGTNGGIWKFECKGLGRGKPRTHRNNFDRAVASVVSYYDGPDIRLGLSIAEDYLWKYNFGKRLPTALRESIGLWLFLYNPQRKEVYHFEPWHELQYPGAAG
jgi:hypothetical protein